MKYLTSSKNDNIINSFKVVEEIVVSKKTAIVRMGKTIKYYLSFR